MLVLERYGDLHASMADYPEGVYRHEHFGHQFEL